MERICIETAQTNPISPYCSIQAREWVGYVVYSITNVCKIIKKKITQELQAQSQTELQ